MIASCTDLPAQLRLRLWPRFSASLAPVPRRRHSASGCCGALRVLVASALRSIHSLCSPLRSIGSRSPSVACSARCALMRSGSPPAAAAAGGRVARLSLTDEDAPPAMHNTASHSAVKAAADLEAHLPPTYRSINSLCRNLCCCCYSCLPSLRPLFTSFEYVPRLRKLWWVWLAISQLYSTSFHTELVAQLILYAFVALTLFSLVWSAGSRGFHRGLALWQLIIYVPLELYIIFRLAGIDEEDASDPDLTANRRLWIYAIVESITLGLACMLSIGDMVVWLRGKRRVFGHAHIPGASGDEPVSGENSIDPSASADSTLRPSPSYYGRLTDPRTIGGDVAPLDPASSPTDVLHLLGPTETDWTPQTRSEHLLNRAEKEQRLLTANMQPNMQTTIAQMPHHQQHTYQPPVPRTHF